MRNERGTVSNSMALVIRVMNGNENGKVEKKQNQNQNHNHRRNHKHEHGAQTQPQSQPGPALAASQKHKTPSVDIMTISSMRCDTILFADVFMVQFKYVRLPSSVRASILR